MNVLVLGSNGLVGSSLIRALSSDDFYKNVIGTNRNNLDLFNINEIKKTLKEVNPDVVINAAAKVGGILANNTYRTEFILENLKINVNLLEALIPYSKVKLINLGSSCIYPLGAENPIKEEYIMSGKLEKTNSPYAMAKLAAIEMGDALSQQYGHKIINLMPTNLYGPNDNFSDKGSHVIPGLISRMHNAKISNLSSFEVWGTGTPLREFLYVDDLAKSISYILKNDINENILNIGSGEEISIKELVKKISTTLSFDGEIYFNTDFPDGNPRKFLDSTKIFNYGWKPLVSIDQGLTLTYNWFTNNI